MGDKEKICIYVALPTYNGDINGLLGIQLMKAVTRNPHIEFVPNCLTASILTQCFNHAWCSALNEQKDGADVTHFLMVHADIWPEEDQWLEQLLSIMKEQQADVVSVISPMKDNRGLTSTAWDTHFHRPRRITMTEVHRELPKTFEIALINTGMMLVDFTKPWVHDIAGGEENNVPFFFTDLIRFTTEGKKLPTCIGEDWNFSRIIKEKYNAKIVATSDVAIIHKGSMYFSNQDIWGWEHDFVNTPRNV